MAKKKKQQQQRKDDDAGAAAASSGRGGGGDDFIACVPIVLPEDQWAEAARAAIDVFPANAPHGVTDPQRIGVLASKFWGDRAKDLPVAFLEGPPQAFIDRVMGHANAWGEFARVRFRHTNDLSEAVIRVSLRGQGYWSYLGTDALQIPRSQPTLNLQGFTMQTPESEYRRVVRHEFGHALGCPHEQQRQAVLDLLDPAKVIAYFKATQGWGEAQVRAQILTPLEESSLMNPSPADVTSIMCYSFPGSVTKSGQPIPGGLDFSAADRAYFGKTYPLPDQPPPPVDPGQVIVTVVGYNAQGNAVKTFRAVAP